MSITSNNTNLCGFSSDSLTAVSRNRKK